MIIPTPRGTLVPYIGKGDVPGLEHDGIIFMTGFTGAAADGSLSLDPADQIEVAFAKVAKVLEKAGLGFEYLLEMTSYHVGPPDHVIVFKQIRAGYIAFSTST